MTEAQKDQFCVDLEKNGYRKLISCKSKPMDDFEYYKVYRNKNREIKYQIFFQFWDFSKYNYQKQSSWEVSITIMPSASRNWDRKDLDLNVDWFKNIHKLERLAEKFYEFIIKYD